MSGGSQINSGSRFARDDKIQIAIGETDFPPPHPNAGLPGCQLTTDTQIRPEVMHFLTTKLVITRTMSGIESGNGIHSSNVNGLRTKRRQNQLEMPIPIAGIIIRLTDDRDKRQTQSRPAGIQRTGNFEYV